MIPHVPVNQADDPCLGWAQLLRCTTYFLGSLCRYVSIFKVLDKELIFTKIQISIIVYYANVNKIC